MNNESTYAAMRAYIDVAVELKVEKLLNEIRATTPATRAADVVAGPPGKDGRDGTNGIDGKDGHDGSPGGKGERGADGVHGRDGVAGKDGAPGAKGERGADGIATRAELDSIVDTRFAELQVRTFADVYRGVFRAGETYKRGEFATWDGSLHLALSDTTDKPMTSAAWQLVTKRGRDK